MNDINNYKAESLVCQIRKMDHLIKGINTSLRNELTNEMPIGRKSHFDEDIDSAPMFHKSKKQTRLENIEKEMLLKRKNLVKDLLTFRRQKGKSKADDQKYVFRKVFSLISAKTQVCDQFGNSVVINL